MNEIEVLSTDLKNKSLSSNEIVLEYQDALKALDILLNNKWGVLGYEVWFKYPEGKSHFFNIEGKSTVDASESIEKKEKETWDDYVKRSNRYCKDIMKTSYEYWKKLCAEKKVEFYYCITACQEKVD